MRRHATWLVLLALTACAGAAPARAQAPLDPTQTAARIGLARVARDQGRFGDAFAHFRDASRGEPFELALLVEYFWVAQRADVETARPLAAEILRQDPRNSSVRDGLIGILANMRREDELREVAAAGGRSEPESALWPRRVAESYLRTGDGARAATFYAKAASLNGGTSADRALRALATEGTNDKAAALRAWNELGETVWASRPDWSASRDRAVAATRPRPPVATAMRPQPATEAIRAEAHSSTEHTDHGSTTSNPVEAAIARGDFAEAIGLAAPAASVADAPILVREQYGVLLHWTGDDAKAEPVLRAVVAESPSPRSIDALIEVLRANQRAEDAWSLAARRAEQPAASVADRLMSATLSLETGRFDDAFARASILKDDPSVGEDARLVVAHALTESGRPAEAKKALGSLIDKPGAALVWLQATAAMEGFGGALQAAAPLSHHTDSAWTDVNIKRALWHAALEQRADADRLLREIDAVDPRLAIVARAEIALAEGRSADAAAQLVPLIADARVSWRAKDLLATALAEHGREAEANALLSELRQQRPNDMRLALREAVWRDRQMPSDTTLRALQAVVEQHAAIDGGPTALARALLRAGAHDRALAALSTEASDTIEGRLLRAQIEAARGRLGLADAAFEQLVSQEPADPAWYLAWADVQGEPLRAATVLRAGGARFPNSAYLQERLAQVAWATGDHATAQRAAALALAADSRRTGAWFVQVEAARGEPARVAELAQRFEKQFIHSPGALLGMADLLAGMARSPGDAAATRALEWTANLQLTDPGIRTVATRANLLAALGRYEDAMSEADTLLTRDPALPAARKLQAELLMRSGDHVAAIAAYERYLEVAPGDLVARRQQARIEGWRGFTQLALTRYQAIAAQAPGDVAIEAEIAAKRAYFDERWRDAVSLYDRWIALEPGEAEALLERAQSLDHLGDARRAAEAYQALAENHVVAAAASDRLARRRAPNFDVFSVSSSADAASRRQLLDLTDAGAGFSITLGSRARARIYGGSSFAAAVERRWQGMLAGTEFETITRSPWAVGARLSYQALNGVAPQWLGDARVSWKNDGRLRATAGVENVAILENAQTVDSGLSGWGPAASLHWQPRPAFTLDVRANRLSLDDSNVRRVVRADVSQRLLRQRNELRLLGSTEHLAYAELRAAYFTPGSFWRHDVGAEWRGWLETPRFFGDRERWVSAAYLYGADNRDTRYHTVRADFTYEFSNGIGVVAGGHLVRSAVYDSTRATIGLRLSRVTR